MKGGWLDWDFYEVGILTFKRNDLRSVRGVTWVWEENAEPFLFEKLNDSY